MIRKLNLKEVSTARVVDNTYFLFEVLNDMGFKLSNTNADVDTFIDALANDDYGSLDIINKTTKNVYRLCSKPGESVCAVSFNTKIGMVNTELKKEITALENIITHLNHMNFN